MLCVRDVMTSKVVSVAPATSLREAMELLTTRHISGAPVVDGDDVVGVVSATDLLGFAAAIPSVPLDAEDGLADDVLDDEPGIGPSEWANGDEPSSAYFTKLWEESEAREVTERVHDPSGSRNVLEEHTVAEAMTPLVYVLPPSCPLVAAARFMRTVDVHRVLVMDHGTLLGIVTTTDIRDAVAERGSTIRV